MSRAVALLQDLVRIPSPSGQEDAVVARLEEAFRTLGWKPERAGRNLTALLDGGEGPLLLLNSHTDTVPVGEEWTKDPLAANIEDGRIYGRGSNDAKGCLTAMILGAAAAFEKNAPKGRVLLAASCEEEVLGQGLEKLLPSLPKPDAAVVGEPTGLKPAVAQKGLIVLEITAHGRSAHAAHGGGVNAIGISARDVLALSGLAFDKSHSALGRPSLNVTQIAGGTRHNVIPDRCKLVVDIRTTPDYSVDEIVATVRGAVEGAVHVRSSRLGCVETDPESSDRESRALGESRFVAVRLRDALRLGFFERRADGEGRPRRHAPLPHSRRVSRGRRARGRRPLLRKADPQLLRTGGLDMKKLWQTATDLDSVVEAYTVGDDPALDSRLLRYEVYGSLAHAAGLAEIGVLTRKEHAALRAELTKLHDRPGSFAVTRAQEDIHTAVEQRLTAAVGDIGAKIHAGRSRNDQVQVDLRLFLKDRLLALHAEGRRRGRGLGGVRKAPPGDDASGLLPPPARDADDGRPLGRVARRSPLGRSARPALRLRRGRRVPAGQRRRLRRHAPAPARLRRQAARLFARPAQHLAGPIVPPAPRGRRALVAGPARP